jgi:hypothetical protein
MGEGGIGRIDLDMRHDRYHGESALPPQVAQADTEEVTHLALRHGAEGKERLSGNQLLPFFLLHRQVPCVITTR